MRKASGLLFIMKYWCDATSSIFMLCPWFSCVCQYRIITLHHHYHGQIGYLEYCKECGFASCYLWVCPPVKGDDYLFHCHPDFQKNLPRKKLLKWFSSISSSFLISLYECASTAVLKLFSCAFLPRGYHVIFTLSLPP